jgi:hypothetical protein
MYRYLVLYFGFVESSLVSCVVFKNKYNGRKTKKDTIKSFVLEQLEIFKLKSDFYYELDECCMNSKIKLNNFCGICGKNLKMHDKVNILSLENYIKKIPYMDANCWGADAYGYKEEWCPFVTDDCFFDINKTNTVFINNAAVKIMEILKNELET